MAITLVNGRQNPLVAKVNVALADMTSTVAATAVKLPVNAIVTGGYFTVTQVWDSTSSDVLDIGHTSDDDEYTASAINLQALGVTALTITGYVNTTGEDIIFTWTSGGGTPTTGAGFLIVEYIIDGRATEVQPN